MYKIFKIDEDRKDRSVLSFKYIIIYNNHCNNKDMYECINVSYYGNVYWDLRLCPEFWQEFNEAIYNFHTATDSIETALKLCKDKI